MSKLEEAIGVIIQELNLQTENNSVFCQKVSQKIIQSFSGYSVEIEKIFQNKIPNEGLNTPIEFKNIEFISYCKHHMTPIIGNISLSYTPNQWLIGLSRIIECINAFTQRLQLQESLTIEIANCVFKNLQAKAVFVEIEAKHYCMQKTVNESLPFIKTSHKVE